MTEYDITGCIVTYKNNPVVLSRAINSFLDTSLNVKLYIVDNSPTNELKKLCSIPGVDYIFMNCNKGFGAGHNTILRSRHLMGKYHLVLNPDIRFGKGTLETLYNYMEQDLTVGNIMPKVTYPNGSLQYLCKLLPTPIDWIVRMFIPLKSIKSKIDYNFEMRFADYNTIMNVPYLSGCFMFLRKSTIEDIGLFDEGIFMYGEDTDLNRRIYQKYKTLYYPKVTIIHDFEKGSHKNLRLLWIHIKAAIYYLNKWGWVFDNERTRINKATKLKYKNNNI
ncbi:MAG: glycosyltransferase family 2 protein [Bacteroidota bacterium]|jgi:GT2 family glycosyltransferase|nr:glycosyltransferase family 2 protein [Bacteroidota bacterium]